jgi:hypothetical protein
MGAMRTGGYPKTRPMRRAAWIAFALAGALALAGCSGPNFDSAFPVGSCAVVTGTANAGYGVNAAHCSKAHTHIVIARTGPGQTCPPGTNAMVDMSPGARCFRADASPRPTP